MNDMVEISVIGGVVDVSKIPPGITVQIRDYDVEGCTENIQIDDDGEKYILSEYKSLK